jgi:YgiT-type zinc finger domain-containing protein
MKIQHITPEIICSVCGVQAAREVKRPQIVGKGENMTLVEGVPMISCRNCGNDYFSIEVARLLDAIRKHPEQYPAIKEIPVVEFA